MTPELKAKHPSESLYEKYLRFSEDTTLRDQYINMYGDIRFGKVLEEMDMAAGMAAYKHSDGFELDLTIVTAACDRIDLQGPIPSHCDLRILGQVNHVGKSSMEIGIRLDSMIDGEWQLKASAYFIMVARKGTKGHPVHRLIPKTDEEWRRETDAKRRDERRRQEKQHHIMLESPTAEESKQLHELFLTTHKSADEILFMADTHRQTTVIMHPQERNIHHKIFGGHIMRMSFETAWTVAHLFCRRRPLFVCVDHFDFIKPVEIGSIVSFNGMITFTGRTSVIVEVSAEVINPRTGKTDVTNISYFTFVAVDDECKPMIVPRVYPHTYEEGLKYLDGRRRHVESKRILRESRNGTS